MCNNVGRGPGMATRASSVQSVVELPVEAFPVPAAHLGGSDCHGQIEAYRHARGKLAVDGAVMRVTQDSLRA